MAEERPIERGQVWVSVAQPDRVIEIDQYEPQWGDVVYHLAGKPGRRKTTDEHNLRRLYCLPHPADEGHTFRISFESRTSSIVVGDAHHRDAPEFDGIVHTVEVRAWSLKAALEKAAALPFNVLMGEDEDG